MKIKKICIMFLLITITLIQIGIYMYNIYCKNYNNSINYKSVTNDNVIYFEDLNNDLKSIKNAEIINTSLENNQWNINIQISGTKEEVAIPLKDILKMEKYQINEYNIQEDNGDFLVKLGIYRRK